jgi:hypothetical protein
MRVLRLQSVRNPSHSWHPGAGTGGGLRKRQYAPESMEWRDGPAFEADRKVNPGRLMVTYLTTIGARKGTAPLGLRHLDELPKGQEWLSLSCPIHEAGKQCSATRSSCAVGLAAARQADQVS